MRVRAQSDQSTLSKDQGSSLKLEPSAGFDHLSAQLVSDMLELKLRERTRTWEKVVVHRSDEALLILARRDNSDLLPTVQSLLRLILKGLGEGVAS
jgi:hypothetical protein